MNAQTITAHLYYERLKSAEEIARYPEHDQRKNACFLSCDGKDGRFDHLLQMCAGLTPYTMLCRKDSPAVSFLPKSFGNITFGNSEFPVTFRSIVCRPFDASTSIYFGARFEELNIPKARSILHNFLFVLMCAAESSWKEKSRHPYILKIKNGSQKSWNNVAKIGWRYGSGSSNPLTIIDDICDVLSEKD